MDCKRLPGNYHNNIKPDNKPKHQLSNLPQRLTEFRKKHLQNDGLIELCYTDMGVIVIISKNTIAWDEKLHEQLCDEFDVILHAVEKNELFEPRNYKLNVYYHYIPKGIDKYNDEFSVKFKDIRFS